MLISLTYALPVNCVWGYSNVPIINANKKISTLILNEQKRPPYPFLGRSRDAELGAVEPVGGISGVSGLAGARMARDLISRFYRAPDWGDDVRPLPPNEAHAQRVEQVVQKQMQPLERRIVDAEYVHPWASGRWRNGRVGAARHLKLSLNSYEAILCSACLKVEQAFGQ